MRKLEGLPNPDHFEAVDGMLGVLGIDISEAETSPVIATFVNKLFKKVAVSETATTTIQESEGDT